jgi:uracil-DNA glycosylase family 4
VSDGRELAREFLEQQRALGGDPVILPEVPGRGIGDGGPVAPQPPPPTHPASRIPSPDLPPPGLSYDPPGGDLFSNDPVPQAASLEVIAQLVAGCTKCRLCDGRRHTVPGEGAADARLVVVGEGPGRVEDETGRPFVGPAGELLTKILGAIELPRERVFICNVVKCRPPENRLPQFDEIAACVPYLFRQIEIVKPKVILAMGGTAAQTVLNTKQSLGALRNHVHRFRGIPVIVTYHPAALLRNPNWKKPTWDDVRIARRLIA